MYDKVTEILQGYTEIQQKDMRPDMLLVDDLGLRGHLQAAGQVPIAQVAVDHHVCGFGRFQIAIRVRQRGNGQAGQQHGRRQQQRKNTLHDETSF